MSIGTGGGIDGSDEPVLIGIDAGTTSIRAIAFDLKGRKLAVGSRPTPMHAVETGGEYDPDEIWGVVLEALSEVGAGARRPAGRRHSRGQRRREPGADRRRRPIAGAVDRLVRPADRAAGRRRFVDRIGEDRVFAITGHAVQHYLHAGKLMWMREHWPEAMARARHVLMMADWIAYPAQRRDGDRPDARLAHALFRHRASGRWSDEMLALAGLDTGVPAPLAASGTALGRLRAEVAAATGLAGTPMVGVGGHDHVVGGFAAGLTRAGHGDRQHRHGRGDDAGHGRAARPTRRCFAAASSRARSDADRRDVLSRAADLQRRRRDRVAARRRRRHPDRDADRRAATLPARAATASRFLPHLGGAVAARARSACARRLRRPDAADDPGDALSRGARGAGHAGADDASTAWRRCRASCRPARSALIGGGSRNRAVPVDQGRASSAGR